MDSPTKGPDGFYHPKSDAEVRDLILYARANNKLLRVRGSAHSALAAIFTTCESNFRCGNVPPSDSNLNVMLDQMRRITNWDDENMQVTVEAGCHLGLDPSDPTHTSTWENSLFYQMKERKWAMPDMGGIIHQAVGGFLSTGSAGSTLHASFNEQLVGLRIIDGNGNIIDLDQSDERFYAAGVSLGLLGVITRATFQCVPSFDIVGQQATTTIQDCEIDLFGDGSSGKPSLEQYFKDTEHTRLMWWPQKGAERMEVWKATMIKPTKSFKADPYIEFPPVMGSRHISEILADIVMSAFAYWSVKGVLGSITRFFLRTVHPFILRMFEPLDGKKGPQKFRDTWWHGLPMDNTASDKLVPTRFTEVWIPLSRCQEMMQTMQKIYDQNGIWATGTYSTEIYPTPASKYWMSAAYGQDVVKVDVFWFGNNKGNPIELFYPQFWEGLEHLDFRPHWGKYLPYTAAEPQKWLNYVRDKYPKWDDFMALRDQMDPNQIFVSDYWRRHLGIPAK